MLRPYPEILSASDRSSFFLIRSVRLARDASVSNARVQITARPAAQEIRAIHQYKGILKTKSVKECMVGNLAVEIGYEENTCASSAREDYRSPTPLRPGSILNHPTAEIIAADALT